ncbi:MAG TPA: XRE family transcriptional regulator [Gaiellaceae bacterium]|jgi:transcriptional regulator with XRE-family HTH domain
MAERLRARRLELGLSLGDLAELSGVSKAMIAKVEATTSSPTAGVLGRLCGGLGITMSALMAAVETEDATQLVAADQPRWRDPATGLERVAVSPRTTFGAVDVALLQLPAGTVVDYPAPPSVAHSQHIVGVAGHLRFTVGRRSFEVGPGDCVAARIDRPTRFEALGDEPAEYLVIVERASR